MDLFDYFPFSLTHGDRRGHHFKSITSRTPLPSKQIGIIRREGLCEYVSNPSHVRLSWGCFILKINVHPAQRFRRHYCVVSSDISQPLIHQTHSVLEYSFWHISLLGYSEYFLKPLWVIQSDFNLFKSKQICLQTWLLAPALTESIFFRKVTTFS